MHCQEKTGEAHTRSETSYKIIRTGISKHYVINLLLELYKNTSANEGGRGS